MRKAALGLIITISIGTAQLYAVCKTEACKRATAWKIGYTAIVLDDNISRADYFAVLDAVKANHGVVAIEAERVFLGWLPVTSAGKVRAARGVSAVVYERVQHPEVFVHRDDALAALSFFNRVQSGEFEDTVEAGLAIAAEPLAGCVSPDRHPARVRAQSIHSVLDRQLSTDDYPDQRPGADLSDLTHNVDLVHSPNVPVKAQTWSWFNPPWLNPEMKGRITVQVFRLDSDGPDADGLTTTNLYTWTSADYATARDQGYGAYTYWVNEAANQTPPVTLSFRVESQDPLNRHTRAIIPTPIHYEPIMHSSSDDYKWVNDALAANGYGATPVTPENVTSQNVAFNQAKQNDPVYGPFDGSYSLYITYNPSPSPTTFTDGQGAYVDWLGGPYAMVNFRTLNWGSENLGRIITHETGHIFWACDEYYDAARNMGCSSCLYCTFNIGPRNQQATPWITNANCERSPTLDGSSCDAPLTFCMMKRNDYALCPHTKQQIGW